VGILDASAIWYTVPLRLFSFAAIFAILKLEVHRESDCVGTDERGETVWRSVFLDFARYRGFTPRLCRP
jgi:hypothetical protein